VFLIVIRFLLEELGCIKGYKSRLFARSFHVRSRTTPLCSPRAVPLGAARLPWPGRHGEVWPTASHTQLQAGRTPAPRDGLGTSSRAWDRACVYSQTAAKASGGFKSIFQL